MADASLAVTIVYRDDVVRIGRVAHAEKKAKRNDGKQRDHLSQTAAAARDRMRRVSRNSEDSNQFRRFPPCVARIFAGDSRIIFRKALFRLYKSIE